MGMDQYLYKVRKISDRTAKSLNGKTYEELCELGYMVAKKETYKHSVQHILPYLQEINVMYEYVDSEKMMQDYKIPKSADLVSRMQTKDKCAWSFIGKDGKEYFVEIPTDVVKSKYIRKALEPAYVYKETMIAYWRNEYKLADTIEDDFGSNIENCMYCPMNDEMWDDVLSFRSEWTKPVYRRTKNTDNSIVCYYHW